MVVLVSFALKYLLLSQVLLSPLKYLLSILPTVSTSLQLNGNEMRLSEHKRPKKNESIRTFALAMATPIAVQKSTKSREALRG